MRHLFVSHDIALGALFYKPDKWSFAEIYENIAVRNR